VSLYIYPCPKHITLSLSQVMEHHFTYLQWGCLGDICGRLGVIVFIEGIKFFLSYGSFLDVRLWVVNSRTSFDAFIFHLKEKKGEKKNQNNKKTKEKKTKKRAKFKKGKNVWIKGLFNSFPLVCGSFSIGVGVVVRSLFPWFIVGCSTFFLAISSTNPKNICLPLSPYL